LFALCITPQKKLSPNSAFHKTVLFCIWVFYPDADIDGIDIIGNKGSMLKVFDSGHFNVKEQKGSKALIQSLHVRTYVHCQWVNLGYAKGMPIAWITNLSPNQLSQLVLSFVGHLNRLGLRNILGMDSIPHEKNSREPVGTGWIYHNDCQPKMEPVQIPSDKNPKPVKSWPNISPS
jgi:hypothetical protein